MEIRFKGEDFIECLPAEEASVKYIFGVDIYRLVGFAEQITESVKMIEERFPGDEKEAYGDAIWLGTMRTGEVGTPHMDVYELIVAVKRSRV